MTVPILTFFNPRSGTGKTSLTYHVAWMLAEIGHQVLLCDLDPQAHLTSAFLDEDDLEAIWHPDQSKKYGGTIFQSLELLVRTGDIQPPRFIEMSPNLSLLSGDLSLLHFENVLSEQWFNATNDDTARHALRTLSSFWTILQEGAKDTESTVVFLDVGSSLGAINRSALIAADKLIVPLSNDLFSLRGLQCLAHQLDVWKDEWNRQKERKTGQDLTLPDGRTVPLGYVVVQPLRARFDRSDKLLELTSRIPAGYAELLSESADKSSIPLVPADDEHCLAAIRQYRSLIQISNDSRKPIFHLTPADGAMGVHALAVRDAYEDFLTLARKISELIGLKPL